MKILHTSDWHLGRKLFGRPRYDEHQGFLDWLTNLLDQRGIDTLLIAGDIFDTTTPSHRSQSQYYRFLCAVAETGCRHVVAIAGNHDSPSLIEAPATVLRHLNIHVLGQVRQDPDSQVLVLKDGQGRPELMVCAVPFLRDRDIRKIRTDESIDDKARNLQEGIRDHYQNVFAAARSRQAALDQAIPVTAMGHLFTAGARTTDGDGVRELYVGSLARVPHDIFPDWLDYVALGHLHAPQRVGGNDTRRYCGAPLPMGFAEAGRPRQVVEVYLGRRKTAVTPHLVPCFQRLETLKGDLSGIARQIKALENEQDPTWIEIIYDSPELVGDLNRQIQDLVKEGPVKVLRVRNQNIITATLNNAAKAEELDQLRPTDVFQRCLDAHEVIPEQQKDMHRSFAEILSNLHQEDPHAH